MSFDANAYWANKPMKKWVVNLYHGSRRDERLVSASTPEGALRTAKANSTISLKAKGVARLATPEDLGVI